MRCAPLLLCVVACAACSPTQSPAQRDRLLHFAGDPDQHAVLYRCWDDAPSGAAEPRSASRQRGEHCYLRQPEGFASLAWDQWGRLTQADRGWDLGSDTTRWAAIRDSVLTAVASQARDGRLCFGPPRYELGKPLIWAWRLHDMDVMVLALPHGHEFGMSVTASRVAMPSCWATKRPAA